MLSPSSTMEYLPPHAWYICLYASWRRFSRSRSSSRNLITPTRSASFTGAYAPACPGALTIVAPQADTASEAASAKKAKRAGMDVPEVTGRQPVRHERTHYADECRTQR